MNRVLFSIIVPACNAESFIEDCVSSVCEQQFDSNRYEVIVVDDGSADNTASLVRKLQEKYCNLLLICQENGRQGRARNTGVKHAVGQYIMFLDSDDKWLSQGVFARLHQIITEHNPDYIFTKGYTSIHLDDSICGWKDFVESEVEIIDADTCIASHDFSFSCCNYVYRREIFDEKGISFAEKCFFEDLDFCVKSLFAMGGDARVAKLYFPYYGYRENPVSTTRNGNIKLWLDNLQAIERLLKFVLEASELKSKALKVTMLRCKNDLLRKPWCVFKANFAYGECRAFYKRWLEVLYDMKKKENFREWVSTIPLCVFFTYGVMYRSMCKLKYMMMSK